MWDMAYPLRVGEQVIGVLFAGQILLKQDVSGWREAVAGCAVDLEAVDREDQIADIKAAIVTANIPDPAKRAELVRIVEEDPKGEALGVAEFKNRIKEFINFGQITQALVDQLYQARKAAAEQEL